MEWLDKVKLVQLGNAINSSENGKMKFQKFCLEYMENFDLQAWDMFSNIISIDNEQMKTDIEFWRSVYLHIKPLDCNSKGLSFRSSMRIALIQTICEDELFSHEKLN